MQATKPVKRADVKKAKARRDAFSEHFKPQENFRLFVTSDEGVEVFPLPDSGQVTIGRTEDNDITINHSSLSRYHAILRIGPSMQLVDLGSTNGTRVGENELEENKASKVEVDEPIDFGQVLAVVQRTTSATRPRRLGSHDYFEMRLDEECRRAQRDEQSFGVLRLKITNEVPDYVLFSAITPLLRPEDTVALYAPNEYELLLPDTDLTQLNVLNASIVQNLKTRQIEAQIGQALYPQHGRDPDTLIGKASGELEDEKVRQKLDSSIIIEDPSMQRLYKLAERVAIGKISVLLLGETGSGKEVLAHAIHNLSPRANERIVDINCAALTETLLESELFGHEKGSFTGASQTKKGLLEAADGGTLFLDEVGEMPLTTQVKLLRVLETGQVMRVGGTESRKVDVRFVAATNRDLESEIRRGRFREDLYYRLNGMIFNIPPLRERPGELEALAALFLQRAIEGLGLKKAPKLSAKALKLMQNYAWPGNIRELRNTMDRAVLLCEGDSIKPEHLPAEKMASVMSPEKNIFEEPQANHFDPEFNEDTAQIDLSSAKLPLQTPKLTGDQSELEYRQIIDALFRAGGNQTMAADIMGIPRRTFVRRLEAYDIPRPRKAEKETKKSKKSKKD